MSEKTQKILFTGATGQLGRFVLPLLAVDFDLACIGNSSDASHLAAQSRSLDLTACDIDELLEWSQADTVINCAALATDRLCANQPQLARRLNIDVAALLARSCNARQTRFIHLSTDQVYDGTQQNYREDNVAEPLNRYGITKLASEREVLSEYPQSIVLRLALVYGCGTTQGQNEYGPFSHWLIRKLASGQPAKLFTDEYRSIVFNKDIARLFATLANPNTVLAGGIYNAGGCESINRFDFADRLCQQFGFDRNLLIPIATSSLNFAEPRPADCSMNIDKICRYLDWRPTDITNAIAQMHRWY